MPIATLPLIPKAPSGELNVVAIGRISTVHQDIENIEASYRYIEDYLGRIYTGPLKIKLLGEQASGMLTDRATIREAEELVAGGQVDLVIAEDLARIYRNPRYQYDFVQNAVDAGTRVICIGDNLDTADENWEITMGAAALRHGLHIPDTRRRVRRTATHCFHKGGMVQKIRYGYRKLTKEEAAAGHFGPRDLRIAKRPECTPIIRELAERLLRGTTYAALADWLNAEGIEPGPYVKGRRWRARLVSELLADPILGGRRTFRDTIYRPVFRTGRHKPSKNAEPETRDYPELAHLSMAEHEALLREIARRKSQHRAPSEEPPKRRNVPRSRTLWPGQSLTCAACGALLYYVGNHLKCSNALIRHDRPCWNHVQVPAELARARVVAWLVTQLDRDELLLYGAVETVWGLLERTTHGSRGRQRDVARQIAAMERQAANLAAAIAQGGQLATLVQKLTAVEAALQEARAIDSARAQQAVDRGDARSRKDIEDRLPETLLGLSGSSFEFADLLRKVFPEFVILPVQALDTPLVRPRGRLKAHLHELILPGARTDSSPPLVSELEVVLDLFEPPAHIRAIPVCLQAKADQPRASQRKIGARLGLNYMTVKRAFDYARRMELAGICEPYRELQAAPERASRWSDRRQSHVTSGT